MSYALALLSALLYGAGDFFGGHATRRAPALAVTFVSQAVGLLGLAILVPLLSRGAPPAADLAWGAGAGIAGATGVLLLYRGLATGLASVVAPITGVCSIAIPVLFGAVALGERPAPTAVIGILLAMMAVSLLGQGGDAPAGGGRRAGAVGRGVVLAFLSGIAIGAFLLCLGRTSTASGMWPLLAARVVSVVSLAIAIGARRAEWRPSREAMTATIGAGAFDIFANAIYVVAVRQGALGLTATLASLYPVSTVTLAGIVWRERLRPVQVAGVLLAIVAMGLIGWRMA